MTLVIEYDNQPLKFLKKLDKNDVNRILDKIDQTLPNNPVPHNAKSIVNQHNCFRIRIGDYRVLYRVNYQDKKIVIFKIDLIVIPQGLALGTKKALS